MQYVETPIEDATETIQNSNCPDGKKDCPDGKTCCNGRYDGDYWCCPLPNGFCCKDGISCCPHAEICCELGCCPFPNGVCCNDPGGHCCPHGTQCDIEHMVCRESLFLPIQMGLPKINNIDPTMKKVRLFFIS